MVGIMNWINRLVTKIGIVLLASSSLSGCFEEPKPVVVFEEKADQFSGTYDNQINTDQLIFANDVVEIHTNGQLVTLPFTVEDDILTIEVNRSSKEKRPNIVMRIQNDGEVLTCTACALFVLSNVWTKVSAEPVEPVELSEPESKE